MSTESLGNYPHNDKTSLPPAPVDAKDPGRLAADFARRINFYAMQRSGATSRVKELRGAIKLKNAQAFAEAREAQAAAREMLKGLLLSDPGYKEAAEDRKAAAAAIRDVYKEAEAAGLDPAALRIAINLGQMDPFERADTWDAADAYAAAMQLWIKPEL